ncbi:hypothetical protein OHA18_20250 [Kribbella sp. NBC_00709]|uniref:hypothetical protein n=1 Tax=Kribbella sp. NBC_00709 TaxID=2975972 RepID=UPI002E27D9E8|nr:hypothetical protein [Kribbella sp. NBC_00709]
MGAGLGLGNVDLAEDGDGARRGELLALRWHDLHMDQGVVEIRCNFTHRNGKAWEKDTKSHQMRRISLDPGTVELLATHRLN